MGKSSKGRKGILQAFMEESKMKCYIKDYPRPQFVRTDWENLNGTWDFGFDDENAGEKEKWYQEFKGDKKINVPFTYETKFKRHSG